MTLNNLLMKSVVPPGRAACVLNVLRKYNSGSHNGTTSTTDNIINCERITRDILDDVKIKIEDRLMRGGSPPRLSMVLFWEEVEARRYAEKLLRSCDYVGIETSIRKMSPSMSSTDLHDILVNFGYDSHTDAGMIVLPLSKAVQVDHVHIGLDLQKDIDGFGVSYRKHMWGNPSYLPAKVSATLEVLRRCSARIALRTTLLHGKTRNLKVLKTLISQTNHTKAGLDDQTTVIETDANTPTSVLNRLALSADVIVTEVGVPKSITVDMVKEGSHVIDLSHNRVQDDRGKSRIVGDVDIDEVKNVAAGVTPVPGGLGPLSIAMVCKHTLLASKFSKSKDSYF